MCPNSDMTATPQAIILAAGKGLRMGSDQPKVLFEVADKPIIRWVVQACRQARVSRNIIVVGEQGDMVAEALADEPDCVFVEQHKRLGTGHAAQMAESLFDPAKPEDVFVLAGDAPLIRARTLKVLLEAHRDAGASTTLATSNVADPTGYGRVLRDGDGRFEAIVEEKDATDEQRRVTQINPSYYCFRSDALFETLKQVKNANAQGEYYLTDVPGLQRKAGLPVAVLDAVPPEDVLGVNTPEQLEQVDRILRERLAREGQSADSP